MTVSTKRGSVLGAFLCLIVWTIPAPTAVGQNIPASDAQRHIEQVEACLPDPVVVKDDPSPCPSLSERMAELHVPGVSIAVVHNGVIEWAQGFGMQEMGSKPIDADTLFQAGSISKPISAMAALHFVQEGKLSLDSDVNAMLSSWKIPANSAIPGATVTLRELLSHTAGISVHGFWGYPAGVPIPTLNQILNGEKPANSDPIRIESTPGDEWKYSGGGYIIIEQLLEDVGKEPFSKLLHDTVLAPIGMTHSTYQQPLSGERLLTAATPYNSDGTPVMGGPYIYPELAAAGLWTTPSDLAKYIIETQRSLQNRANHVLSEELTRQMLTPGKGDWGLGVQIGGSSSNPYFSHGGAVAGYRNLFVAYENSGEGAVVMTNSKSGGELLSQIMRSIAIAYNWPDYRPTVRTAIRVDQQILARYIGKYEISPDFIVTISLQADRLMAQVDDRAKQPLFAETETKFFSKTQESEIEFAPDEKGATSYLVLRSPDEKDRKGMKQ